MCFASKYLNDNNKGLIDLKDNWYSLQSNTCTAVVCIYTVVLLLGLELFDSDH